MITLLFGYEDFPMGAVPLITTELALLVIGGFVCARGSLSLFTRILFWFPGLLLVMGLLAQQCWTLPVALAVFDLTCCCFLIVLVGQGFQVAILGLPVFPFRFGSRYLSSCSLLVAWLQERLRAPLEHQSSSLPGLRRSPR